LNPKINLSATPHNFLDFPRGFALMGVELLSEGKYESLEAVSITCLGASCR